MNNDRLTEEAFARRAITTLRDTTYSSGIHTVFSGFNDAFREYFREDPIEAVQRLAQSGRVEVRPVKRGVMIYLPGEAPPSRGKAGKVALNKILGEEPGSTITQDDNSGRRESIGKWSKIERITDQLIDGADGGGRSRIQ